MINQRYSAKNYIKVKWIENGFVNENICPFCKKDNLINENNFTYLIKNNNPYYNTKEHLLLTPKRHIRTWNELNIDELNIDELKEIQKIISNYLDKWYVLLWRHFIEYGHKNGWSVYHMHIHLILN